MIQELFGAAGLIGGERKISISGSIFEGTNSPLPPSTTTTTTITTTTTTATTASNNTSSTTNSDTLSNSESQNLRCPRCDSSNTKFCYYNNYNLTQPRHFCKTCRRYWTKGGALRNLPIGGGCRKNKSSSMSAAMANSSSVAKMKTVAYEIGRPGLGNGFDHEFLSSPIMWGSTQNSQLLGLLRTNQSPKINLGPLSSSVRMKEEAAVIGAHLIKAEQVVATGALNSGTTVLDPLSQVPTLSLCSSLWKNNQHHQAQNYQQNGYLVGHEVQNSGVQELYQRLKSSNNYYNNHSTSPMVLSNAASTASPSSTTILESAPVAGVELVYWNPVLSWSDLPATNGDYP